METTDTGRPGDDEVAATGVRVAKGASILLGARGFLHLAAFGQSVVVARCIDTDDIGTFAMAIATVGILSQLIQVGGVEKLVRDSDAEFPRSFSAALVVQLGMAVVVSLLLALGASVYVVWSGDVSLALATVSLGILFFQSSANLPAVVYSRRLEFGVPAMRGVVASSAGVATTIGLAISGFGLWALVLGQFALVLGTAALFWLPRAPRPPMERAGRRDVRSYVSFGLPLWSVAFLSSATERTIVLVVSAFLGRTTVAHLHMSQTLYGRLLQASHSVMGAAYPALAEARDDRPRLRGRLDHANRVVALLGFPLGCGLALFAGDFVPWALGVRWEAAIPFVSIYCLFWGVGMIGHASPVGFLVLGETRLLAGYGTVTQVFKLVAVAAGIVWLGVGGFILGMVVTASLATLVQSMILERVHPGTPLLREAAPAVATVAAAVLAVRVVEVFGISAWAVRLAAFVVVLVVGVIVLQRPVFSAFWSQVRRAWS